MYFSSDMIQVTCQFEDSKLQVGWITENIHRLRKFWLMSNDCLIWLNSNQGFCSFQNLLIWIGITTVKSVKSVLDRNYRSSCRVQLLEKWSSSFSHEYNNVNLIWCYFFLKSNCTTWVKWTEQKTGNTPWIDFPFFINPVNYEGSHGDDQNIKTDDCHFLLPGSFTFFLVLVECVSYQRFH